MIYIDRLVLRSSFFGSNDCYANFNLRPDNAKNIIIIAISVAAKFMYEKYETNTIFCAAYNQSKKEMRLLFRTFLKAVQYDLFVREEDFSKYQNRISIAVHKKLS